ncbi:MAG: archaellin/type IV pilin N-terminal domain-containing protein [Candidatus Pacearchaeota archaeon]
MKLNNKKAVSDVVTTVLLILLAIAAVVIVWVVIQNFVSNNLSNIGSSTGCLETQLRVVSVNSTTSSVFIRRDSGSDELSGIVVYVDGTIVGGIDYSQSGSETPIKVGETRNVTLNSGLLSPGSRVETAAKIGNKICDLLSKPFIVQ